MKCLLLFLSLLFVLPGCNKASFKQMSAGQLPGTNTAPGTPTQIISQTFTEPATITKTDVLIVVDNALSIAKKMRQFPYRFRNFIPSLAQSGMDWQIGVTTTDVTYMYYGLRGALLPFAGSDNGQRIIRSGQSNAEQLFFDTVVRPETVDCPDMPTPICANPFVQPLRAAIEAMDKRNDENTGFFRENSALSIVMVTNENEMINGSFYNPTKPQEVVDHFNSIWPNNSKQMSVYGVVVKSGDANCMAEMKHDWVVPDVTPAFGTFIEGLAELEPASQVGSICSDDYSAGINMIADPNKYIFGSVTLLEDPIPGSLILNFNPPQTLSWKIEGKVVTFSAKPLPQTVISVAYQVPSVQ